MVKNKKSKERDNRTKLEQQLDLNPEDAIEVEGLVIAQHWTDINKFTYWGSVFIESVEGDFLFSSPAIFGEFKEICYTIIRGPSGGEGLVAMLEAAKERRDDVWFKGYKMEERDCVISNVRFKNGFEYELWIYSDKT